jgi:hypothetical protein
MTRIEWIVAAFEAWKVGPTRWVADCPSCRGPRKLSISLNTDETRVHLKCHAGCAEFELQKAIGLVSVDLNL